MTFLLYPCKNLLEVAKIKPCLTKPADSLNMPKASDNTSPKRTGNSEDSAE